MQSHETTKNFDKVKANQILANRPRVVYGVGCGDMKDRIERYAPAIEQLKLLESQFCNNLSAMSALDSGDTNELNR